MREKEHKVMPALFTKTSLHFSIQEFQLQKHFQIKCLFQASNLFSTKLHKLSSIKTFVSKEESCWNETWLYVYMGLYQNRLWRRGLVYRFPCSLRFRILSLFVSDPKYLVTHYFSSLLFRHFCNAPSITSYSGVANPRPFNFSKTKLTFLFSCSYGVKVSLIVTY